MYEFWRYTRLIQNSEKDALKQGLLASEYFLYSSEHAGLIQYWSSFKELESWSLGNKDHKSWWGEVEKTNKWNNLNIYHEVFVVPKENIETIYNLSPKRKEKKEKLPALASVLPHNTSPEKRARKRFLSPPNTTRS